MRPNLKEAMVQKMLKYLGSALTACLFLLLATPALAGGGGDGTPLDPGKIIIEHVTDSHEWHYATIGDTHVTLPLPVIIYNRTAGKFDFFMSSKFHHGHDAYNGYRLVTDEYLQGLKAAGVDPGGLLPQQIIPVTADNLPDTNVKILDLSITKNVLQMLVSIILLILIMTTIAKKYQKNGSKVAPSGFQNAVEPVITFVRDEVAKPNLGKRYERYLPLLLTIFFFILINNLMGLIPGAANVTGNIALTGVLALISFIVILFSTNKHFWGHIFWYPGVPVPVKFLMLPVELMGIFTKPFALMIRLFANMVAGHVIILSFIILIFIFGAMNTALGYGSSPIFIALAVFIYAIEVLVAFIQAFIFANLTAVFIGQSFEHEGEHH